MDESFLKSFFARMTNGIKPGLGPTRALLDALGNPQDSFAAIHVAGTNGKGSVCAMLSAGLQALGAPIGLFTSPHLVKFNERFAVNGEMIGDGELEELMREVLSAAESIESNLEREITFFELCTGMAFLHFKRHGVKIAVVEVGMGGRLDSTNVLEPLLSVITGIAMDHAQFLGNSIAAIAGEKAGIIKAGRPVVIGTMPEEARAVMVAKAAELHAPLVDAADSASVARVSGDLRGQKIRVSTQSQDYGTFATPLAANYQLANIATYVAAMEQLTRLGLPLDGDAIGRGLREVRWPGRFELLRERPPTLIDGAHNPDGATALAGALKAAKASAPIVFVCGMCADKDSESFFRIVSKVAGKAYTTPIPNPRSALPGDLATSARRFGIDAEPCPDFDTALKNATEFAGERNGTVVICGSLFLNQVAMKAMEANAADNF